MLKMLLFFKSNIYDFPVFVCFRMILESEIFRDLVELSSQDDILVPDVDEAETELLIYFLNSLA